MTETFQTPEATYRGGVYVYEWATLGIRLLLDHLRESDSGPTAEVMVRSTLSGVDSHVHRTRLNLLNTGARRSLVTHLSERLPPLRDHWQALLEYACERTIQQYRQGEPVIRLWEVQPREGLVYRFRPLLHEGAINLIFGAGGSLKSWIAQWIAYCIDSGVEGWEVEGGPVLYLDYERDEYIHRKRLDAIRQGLGRAGTADGILYRRCYQRLVDDLPEIQRQVLEHHIQFLIVDSAGGASGGDVMDNAEAIRCMLGLRSLNVTCLMIAHQPKNAEVKTPFGATFWTNYPSSVWQVRADQEPGSDHADVGLYHHKVNDGRLLKPMGLSFDFENDADDRLISVTVSRSNILDSVALSVGASVVARATEVLSKHGAMSTKVLAEELNVKPDSLRAKLNEKRWKHRFGKDGLDNWHLLDTVH